MAEPLDVAIRMGKPPDSSLIARQLANLACHLYAAPRYLEQFGEPAHPADLAQHECIGFRQAKANVWVLHKADESMEIAVGGRFQLNSVGLIRRLVMLDQGIPSWLRKLSPKTWRTDACVESFPTGRGRQPPSTR